MLIAPPLYVAEPLIPPGVTNLGAGALLGLTVVLILSGKLVPGRERDYWRNAFFEEQAQKRELMETGRVTRDVLRALPDGETAEEPR